MHARGGGGGGLAHPWRRAGAQHTDTHIHISATNTNGTTQAALLKEVKTLTTLTMHPNVVRFCGVCLNPPLVVTGARAGGDWGVEFTPAAASLRAPPSRACPSRPLFTNPKHTPHRRVLQLWVASVKSSHPLPEPLVNAFIFLFPPPSRVLQLWVALPNARARAEAAGERDKQPKGGAGGGLARLEPSSPLS